MFTPDTQLDLGLRILVLGPPALFWVVMAARVIGLRSFSKMIAVDFVVTVATGSLLANAATASDWKAFVQACGAMGMLLLAQALFTWARRKWKPVRALENRPALLMKDGEFIKTAMSINRIAEADVFSKLREANALDRRKVRAVVLETTGDISVLHDGEPDRELLDGISQP